WHGFRSRAPTDGIPEGIRAHRRNMMARNEPTRQDHMGESSPAVAGSKPPTTGCRRWWVKHFMRIRIFSGHRHETPDVAKGVSKAVASVRCKRRLLYRQWPLQL